MRSIRVAWNVVSFMNIFMDSRFFYNVGSPWPAEKLLASQETLYEKKNS
jgi:hypothetical protein